jgi:hypothetical protein
VSTTAQRTLERLAKSINRAFSGMYVIAQTSTAPRVNVRVCCETVDAKTGMGFGGTGIHVTIGGRTMTTDEGGNITALAEDGRELDLRQLPREPAPQPKQVDKPMKVGDFSNVDWNQYTADVDKING